MTAPRNQLPTYLARWAAPRWIRIALEKLLSPERIAVLYGVPERLVRVIPFDRVCAIKVTIPRTMGIRGSGSAFDRDLYGAQQHGPLAELEVL